MFYKTGCKTFYWIWSTEAYFCTHSVCYLCWVCTHFDIETENWKCGHSVTNTSIGLVACWLSSKSYYLRKDSIEHENFGSFITKVFPNIFRSATFVANYVRDARMKPMKCASILKGLNEGWRAFANFSQSYQYRHILNDTKRNTLLLSLFKGCTRLVKRKNESSGND